MSNYLGHTIVIRVFLLGTSVRSHLTLFKSTLASFLRQKFFVRSSLGLHGLPKCLCFSLIAIVGL